MTASDRLEKPARLDRRRLVPVAEWLAVALAASLPWSTSATSILIVLWLLAALPTLAVVDVRRELSSAAGGFPVLLWLLGAIGMLWADVSWSERLHGLSGFHKLLLIPLLLAFFRRSARGRDVLAGFIVSCMALWIASWAMYLTHPLFSPPGKQPGVPVKDYISQAAVFSICIFVLLYLTVERLRADKRASLLFAAGSLALLINILFLATSRTALVVLPVLLFVFGVVRLSWKSAVALLAGLAVIVALSWSSASYLRDRVTGLVVEVQEYRSDGLRAEPTPASERLVFWSKSLQFVAAAPVLGHGTGSIHDQFRRAAVGQTGVGATVANNPHNQILGIAVQLGLIGVALLVAMWVAHLMLFTGSGLLAWVGLVVAGQNIIASLFNSHLFDFTHGWLYVIGVGIAGGQVLRRRDRAGSAAPA